MYSGSICFQSFVIIRRRQTVIVINVSNKVNVISYFALISVWCHNTIWRKSSHGLNIAPDFQRSLRKSIPEVNEQQKYSVSRRCTRDALGYKLTSFFPNLCSPGVCICNNRLGALQSFAHHQIAFGTNANRFVLKQSRTEKEIQQLQIYKQGDDLHCMDAIKQKLMTIIIVYLNGRN